MAYVILAHVALSAPSTAAHNGEGWALQEAQARLLMHTCSRLSASTRSLRNGLSPASQAAWWRWVMFMQHADAAGNFWQVYTLAEAITHGLPHLCDACRALHDRLEAERWRKCMTRLLSGDLLRCVFRAVADPLRPECALSFAQCCRAVQAAVRHGANTAAPTPPPAGQAGTSGPREELPAEVSSAAEPSGATIIPSSAEPSGLTIIPSGPTSSPSAAPHPATLLQLHLQQPPSPWSEMARLRAMCEEVATLCHHTAARRSSLRNWWMVGEGLLRGAFGDRFGAGPHHLMGYAHRRLLAAAVEFWGVGGSAEDLTNTHGDLDDLDDLESVVLDDDLDVDVHPAAWPAVCCGLFILFQAPEGPGLKRSLTLARLLACGSLSHLNALHLSDLTLEADGAGPIIAALRGGAPGLLRLDLSGNGLGNNLCTALARATPWLTVLEELYLARNPITCGGVAALAATMGSVHRADAAPSAAAVSDSAPTPTEGLPRLVLLSLQACSVGDDGVKALADAARRGGFSKLVTLRLDYKGEEALSVGWIRVPLTSSPEDLPLQNVHITGDGLRHLAECLMECANTFPELKHLCLPLHPWKLCWARATWGPGIPSELVAAPEHPHERAAEGVDAVPIIQRAWQQHQARLPVPPGEASGEGRLWCG